MCGICGTFGFSNPLVDENTLRKMTRTLAHRGPDDNGIFIKNNVGLGHTRLSILDLSAAGHQPMYSADKRVVIVYNGELYNYRELKNTLISKGRKFKTRSDTEVLLQSYLEWGTDIFPRLNGMFAISIWDSRVNKMYLVRDRFGIKPLYYHNDENGVVFGSEIKSIFASNHIAKYLNYETLHQYMWYGNGTGINSIYKNINKVRPGSYITITEEGVINQQYWSIENTKEINDDYRTAVINVREKFEAAVKSHLISDVPVGIFLSGGIDSSAITAFASKHYQGKIKTFSVGFDFQKGVNELAKAKLVAEYFDTDHHEIHINGSDLQSTIETLINCHDEPFADAANIPLFLLCKELKNKIKVVLQGDGGDEIFMGYRRYNIMFYNTFWSLLSKFLLPISKITLQSKKYRRYIRFLTAINNQKHLQMALLLTQDSFLNDPTLILNEEMRINVLKTNPFEQYERFYKKLRSLDDAKLMSFIDCQIQLPNTFLEKVDKPTMANSIEVRVPFLDNNLVDYALGLPSEYKIHMGKKKWILRQSLKNIVPDTILNGKKTGFSVPFDYWLKEPLSNYMRSILLDSSVDRLNIFDQSYLKVKIDNHVSGLENNGFILWKALNLVLWHKNSFTS